MTAMQWVIGEKDGKLILVLSVRRNIDETFDEDEREYRAALDDLKEIKQVSLRPFKHHLGYSLSPGDRLYLEERLFVNGVLQVNGVHYFVYEGRADKKEQIMSSLDELNPGFKFSVQDSVPLEKHFISKLIELYRK